jgi:hypothetical protein
MNRRILRLSLFFVLSMTLTLAGLVPASAANPQATVIQTNTEVPIDFFSMNTCTGETVTISGTSHVLFHATGTPSGNSNEKLEINFALQGDSASGTHYVVNETVSTTTASHANGSTVFNSVSHLNVISQGSTDNLKVKLEWHVTVNSNGEVTASRFDFTIECEG